MSEFVVMENVKKTYKMGEVNILNMLNLKR